MDGGKTYNGLELWRVLYWEHEGGDVAVQVHGIRGFHTYPQCTNMKDLNLHVGQWQELRQKHAPNMPEIHLRELFLDILPTELKKEINRRSDCNTLPEMIAFAQKEVTQLNDQRLASMHDAQRKT